MKLTNKMNEAIDYGRKLKDAESFAEAMKQLDIDDYLAERGNLLAPTEEARQEWKQQLEMLRDPDMVKQVDASDLREMVTDQVEIYERNRARQSS